jgi:Tfp pilus assembly protein PilO
MILMQAIPPVPPPVPSIPVDPNLLLTRLDTPGIVMVVLLITVAVTIICWPIARAIARRLEGKSGLNSALQGELDQMHHRLSDLDVLQQRVAELEERLDFAERLLARGEPPATLPRGTPP